MKNQLNTFKNNIKIAICLSVMIFSVSCEDAFKFDLPEAGSIADTSLPNPSFLYIPDATDFRIIIFNNTSTESTNYLWDFDGLGTSTDKDPSFNFENAVDKDTYDVKLTASDGNGVSKDTIITVLLEDKFVPIPVTILNGDFDGGTSDWKFSSFTGGTVNPFNASGDGSFTNYDGSDNGAKTKGAKWTKATSAGAYLSSNTRYAYQAIKVSETLTNPVRNVDYILEFEYAIKTPAEQAGVAPGGNRIYAEILNGHFADGANAVASTPIKQFIASEVKGKTVHTTVQQKFRANASGEVSIVFYAVTDVDVYIDNVKVYAAD